MAKKIIILNKVLQTNYFEINALFWLAVPLVQQPFRADSNINSAYAGATTEELTALKNGEVVEKVVNLSFVTGTSGATIKANLINKYNEEQSVLNNEVKYNLYGSYWDGTAWVNSGV